MFNSKTDPKTSEKMKNGINRLRALLGEEREDDERQGRKDGRNWALDTATPRQLRTIASLADEAMVTGECDAFTAAERLADMLLPEGVGRDEYHRFWAAVAGDDRDEPSDEYVAGFITGAAEAWAQVRAQL